MSGCRDSGGRPGPWGPGQLHELLLLLLLLGGCLFAQVLGLLCSCQYHRLCLLHCFLGCLNGCFGRCVHTVNTSLLQHHQTRVVDVPSEGGHGLIVWVHYRVLQDENRVGNVGGKQPLCPVGISGSLGQESLSPGASDQGSPPRCTMFFVRTCLL